MRRNILIFIAIICCVLTAAAPHGTEIEDHQELGVAPTHTDVSTPVPSNGTPISGNPSIAYAQPKPDEHHHHNDDMGMNMGLDGMGGHKEHHHNATDDGPIPPEQMSYWLWPEHRGLLYTHILLMVISWGFLLPIGMRSLLRLLIFRSHAWSSTIPLPYPCSNRLPRHDNYWCHFCYPLQLRYPRLL